MLERADPPAAGTQILERDRTQAEFSFTLDGYLKRRLTPATVRTARAIRTASRAGDTVRPAYNMIPGCSSRCGGWFRTSAGSRGPAHHPDPGHAGLRRPPRRDVPRRAVERPRDREPGGHELERLKGSWAGASASRRSFRPATSVPQDFDGDGRRDISTSAADVSSWSRSTCSSTAGGRTDLSGAGR